jgi:hypothetical protein
LFDDYITTKSVLVMLCIMFTATNGVFTVFTSELSVMMIAAQG